MLDKTLMMHAHITGADALLLVNGLVLMPLRDGVEQRVAVHEYILAGRNRVQVRALEGSPQSSKVAVECLVSVELVKDRGANQLVQSALVCKAHNRTEHGTLFEQGLYLDKVLDLPVAFPRWRSFDLIGTPNVQAHLPLIVKFVKHMESLFLAGQVAPLLPLFSVRNREIVKAYDLDPQDAYDQFKSYLDMLLSQCELQTEPLTPDSWGLVACESTPVYCLCNKQGAPLFQFKSPQPHLSYSIPMHVAVIDEEVFVVR